MSIAIVKTAREVFSTPQGEVHLSFPIEMSRESCDDLVQWLQLCLRKIKNPAHAKARARAARKHKLRSEASR